MNNSTDIQERETIARIIDPALMNWTADGLKAVPPDVRNVVIDNRNRLYAKADAILALRSNPQPGSEGRCSDALKPGCAGDCERDDGFLCPDDECRIEQGLVAPPAASPTPPTAQPGEVERLRWFSSQPSLELQFGYEDEAGDHVGAWQVHRRSGNVNDREWDLIGQGETVAEAIDRARAALTSSESQSNG